MSHLRLPPLFLALALVLLGPASGLLAQDAGEGEPAAAAAAEPPAAEPPAAQTVEQIHNELRAVRDAMEKALNERDVDGLLSHVTPDVVFTTMNSDVARGPEAIRAYFAKMLEGDGKLVEKVTTHFKPDALSLLYGGDSTAVAYGVSEDHYELTTGQVFDIEARWTATLVRQEGRWLIAAFHYSTNVFDNPLIDAQRSVLIKVASGAVLIAFLIAFFLGRSLGKRSAR